MKAVLKVLVLVALAATLSGAASAHGFKVGDLDIGHPWTRATAGGAKVGGGYLTITNNGKTPDRLVGVSLSTADHGEIHEMKMDGGVMQMRPLANGLEIKPGETVKLAPGGYHAMFMDLKEPLKEGALVKGQLTFEKAGKVDVEFKVEPIGFTGEKSGGSMSGMGGMEGHKH
ncbi:MAG: copper chaperone PCu(A)C [Pseudomonadota bacterium]